MNQEPIRSAPIPPENISENLVQPSSKSKLPLFLTVIIFLVLFGVGGIFLGKYLYSPKAGITTTTISPEITVIPTGATKETSLPNDLISVIKEDAIKQSTETVTLDQVIIGDFQLEGNYAAVAVGISSGGGYVAWVAKVNGAWKVITNVQEPPDCSVIAPYNFPNSFFCNQ